MDKLCSLFYKVPDILIEKRLFDKRLPNIHQFSQFDRDAGGIVCFE